MFHARRSFKIYMYNIPRYIKLACIAALFFKGFWEEERGGDGIGESLLPSPSPPKGPSQGPLPRAPPKGHYTG